MVYPGECVIVGDADLEDVYCARAVKQSDETKINVLVEILYLIRYPIQHAILFTDFASENVPLAKGRVCRLKFIRRCTDGEETAMDYDVSFMRALAAYEAQQRHSTKDVDPREFEILERHKRGELGRQRLIIST